MRAISVEMDQPVAFRVGLRTTLENAPASLSLRDLASYHNLAIEVVASFQDDAVAEHVTLPTRWREVFPGFGE